MPEGTSMPNLGYYTGEQLLRGLDSREARLAAACAALMDRLNELHVRLYQQDLAKLLHDETTICACADAYRMGHEALKPPASALDAVLAQMDPMGDAYLAGDYARIGSRQASDWGE